MEAEDVWETATVTGEESEEALITLEGALQPSEKLQIPQKDQVTIPRPQKELQDWRTIPKPRWRQLKL